MYTGAGFSEWEIGDIDVFIDEDGTHHLFHLIIPNHDYIAHAISKDGIQWKRTNNALFVGHPGEWDDDMLWTMHVSKNKDEDQYTMYYTGLKSIDRGVTQKIGKATSKDLITWKKTNDKHLPIQSEPPHYENLLNNPREWLSFRDPFRFSHNKNEYLLLCARSSSGPTSRRGCVGLARLTNNAFELQPPLHIPFVYDDIECPCIILLKGRFYLIGSIREDIKVRYWFAPEFQGEYHAFHANVLLPKGNYAARTVLDGEHVLINNFYFIGGNVNTMRVLPPPKELDIDGKGRLYLKSYYKWEEKKGKCWQQNELPKFSSILHNPTADFHSKDDKNWIMSSKSGYEYFTSSKPSENYIWDGVLHLEVLGKTGFLLECSDDGSGYHISLDFENGFVQFRAWGYNAEDNKNNFVFKNIQTNQFDIPLDHKIKFKIIHYGNYFELSINGIVKLTLLDYTYKTGKIGIYTCSAKVALKNSIIHELLGHRHDYTSHQL
jgi:beta-fructofuranosidase